MANSTRFRSARGGPRRRSTSWVGGPRQDPLTVTAAGAVGYALGTGTTEDGTTLVRTRGQFTWSLTVVTSIGDGFDDLAVGIGVTTEEAFTVGGITSLPSPLADLDWDGWLFHHLVGDIRGFSTTELGRAPMESGKVEIDSKAMRKFEDGMVVFGAFELGTESGAASLVFQSSTRLLVKLP